MAAHHTDFIFPDQPSISSLLSSLKRSTLSIHNRLNSILADAEFVARVSASFKQPLQPLSQSNESKVHPDEPLDATRSHKKQDARRQRKERPLVANERCGSWYVPPDRKGGSAYFKSTDGHERAWKFSTRRLNLHLVDLIEENDGIIIVDSTRRGKRMPDALSTTIPIWCTVLNLTLLSDHPLSSQLFLPPHLLSTTHAQVSALIPSFVAALKELNLQNLPTLTKPLRPFWVTQDSVLPDANATAENGDVEQQDQRVGVIYEDYRPVICCTASRRVTGMSEMDEQGYIQGAADDTENWAHGLTPLIFWNCKDELLNTSEPELPALIARLIDDEQSSRQDTGNRTTRLTEYISVCPLPLGPPPPSPPLANTSPTSGAEAELAPDTITTSSPAVCHISLTTTSTKPDEWVQSPTYMQVGLGKNPKTASKNLRLALPDICTFAASFFKVHLQSGTEQGHPPCHMVIACDSGKDTSVGIALALSCYLFDEEGKFRIPDENMSFTKTMVKITLGAIMTAYPAGNPSRQTLQSVNSFLMDWRK